MQIVRFPVIFSGRGGQYSAEVTHNLNHELVIVQLYRKEGDRWHPEIDFRFAPIDADHLVVSTGQRWAAVAMRTPMEYDWMVVVVG
jgi:hypothetical protein